MANNPKYKLWSFFESSNKQHRTVLSCAMEYGWDMVHPKTGKIVTDLGKLDKWLRGKYTNGQSPVKKPLLDMTSEELSKVIYALEKMTEKKYK